jgi:hypothetical protein
MCPNNKIPQDIRTSGILRNVDLEVVTDVSGQHIGPIFKNV